MNKFTLGFAVSSILLWGCNAPSSGGSGSSSATTSSAGASKPKESGAPAKEPTAAAATAVAKKLDKLGLTVEVPAEATLTEMGESVMISTDATTLTVKAAGATDPKTVEDGKSGAMLGDKGRNLKGDKTADGWIVTFENTGSAGDNYWLSMRREINKKGYMCETTLSNEAQRKAAIAVCNSLKP